MARAPYLQVYDTLLTQIKERKILPGIAMPGENCLAESYGVSRPTLRRALQKLAAEGFIGCRPGIGWTVIANDPVQPSQRQRELVIGIDIVADDWGAFYYAPILRGMRRAAAERRCRLQLLEKNLASDSNLDPIDALALVKVHPEEYDFFARSSANGKPVVLLNRMPPQPELGFIAVDYRAEAVRAVEYLLQIGHRRIAIISERPHSDVSNQRIEGWRQAFRQAGLEPPEDLNLRPESITEAKLGQVLLRHRPTAIFVAMGCCVMPTLLAAARVNLRIPEEISLFSFDDIGAAALPDTPISCIKMPLDTMGELAIDYLARRFDNPDATPVIRRIMPSALVINESCRRPDPKS